MKRVADFFLFDVNRGQHDVAGRFAAQLHDPLTQVGVDDLDPLLQVVVQTTLFGQHRLALDDPRRAVVSQDPQHDFVVLVRVGRPMNDRSERVALASN